MRRGVETKQPPSRSRELNSRDLSLLGEAMQQHCCVATGGILRINKGIQDTIVHVSATDSELINPITQIVCLRASQFMPQLGQSLNRSDAFFKCLHVGIPKIIQENKNRRSSTITKDRVSPQILVKNYPAHRH